MKRPNRLRPHILALTITCAVLVLGTIQFAESQASSGTIVSVMPAQNTARLGETLTVNITVSNVQNLYGIDLTLDWNSSVLQVQSAFSRLGVESHLGGVLHEAIGSPILVVEDNASRGNGEYRLVATSQELAASFNGSGTIATLTFNVTSIGHSDLSLQSELADHPLPGETTSELIAHMNVNGSVDAAIPEFPEAAILALLVACATVTLVFSKKLIGKNIALTRTHIGFAS